MARSARSAATERAYLHFGGGAVVVAGGGPIEEFDESDVWGAFTPAPAPAEQRLAHHRPVPAAARKAKVKAPVAAGTRPPAHGSLPVKIPDWSRILGDAYRGHAAAMTGDWELDDADEDDVVDAGGAVVPPHELAWRRRAASLSVHAPGLGRTLRVRDAVWKRTTGFQD